MTRLGCCWQVQRLRWQAGERLSTSGSVAKRGKGDKGRQSGEARIPRVPLRCTRGCAGSRLLVELNPMEIRSFLLTVAVDWKLLQIGVASS